ncbi:MAG: hypothetical protein M1541_12845 [Acidobacteria bacterium]|nr:hypothetical protein [Acidobacteriota bacterium]
MKASIKPFLALVFPAACWLAALPPHTVSAQKGGAVRYLDEVQDEAYGKSRLHGSEAVEQESLLPAHEVHHGDAAEFGDNGQE